MKRLKDYFGICALVTMGALLFANCGDDEVDDRGTYPEEETCEQPTQLLEQHMTVDLGLPSGTKWAACNIGASSPEDYGDYFAWGETLPKNRYTSDNSVTYDVDYSELKSKGIIDSDGNLTASYDAATTNWGEGWHIPTLTQIKELVNNCTWTWTTKNGVDGYLVTGTSGNSIFLPAAGGCHGTSLDCAGSNGSYWSATACENYSLQAYDFDFGTDYHRRNDNFRIYGQSVRPVTE